MRRAAPSFLSGTTYVAYADCDHPTEPVPEHRKNKHPLATFAYVVLEHLTSYLPARNGRVIRTSLNPGGLPSLSENEAIYPPIERFARECSSIEGHFEMRLGLILLNQARQQWKEGKLDAALLGVFARELVKERPAPDAWIDQVLKLLPLPADMPRLVRVLAVQGLLERVWRYPNLQADHSWAKEFVDPLVDYLDENYGEFYDVKDHLIGPVLWEAYVEMRPEDRYYIVRERAKGSPETNLHLLPV